MSARDRVRDLLVIGAGPCGLAAACSAMRAGMSVRVIDRGSVLAGVRKLPEEMRWFSTADRLEIDGVPFPTSGEKPSRDDGIAYWCAVARARAVDVRPFREALAVEGAKGDFRVKLRRGDGTEEVECAAAVIVSTGALERRPLGIPGEDLSHVDAWFRSPLDAVGCRTVVVGGRNSAAEAALALARAGVEVTIAYRRAAFDAKHVKPWVLPDLENRIREGRIATRLGAVPIAVTADALRLRHADGHVEDLAAERVFLLTGYGPDVAWLGRCGIPVGEVDVPQHDPATYETPRRGVFVAGVVAGGSIAGRVFIEDGRFHGDAVVRALSAG
ncbi:MAG TPA: NAD(P)-binding domain-containing protein [Planctomycetota bacterium]|nr:NAD(P)-binding domain-containing protein [Planctomycetota bacterium]